MQMQTNLPNPSAVSGSTTNCHYVYSYGWCSRSYKQWNVTDEYRRNNSECKFGITANWFL